ncbi:MAG: F0F1 ATP synthase subunit A [Deltaproteobacteria bacterium]|nr:F0F1 ATP synthase subunit A [Deltaproteobacteria bacterium]
MDHHTHWFKFLPGYSQLEHALAGGSFPATDVHHVFAGALVVITLLLLAFIARGHFTNLEKAIIPPRSFGVVTFFELVIETIMGMMESIIGPDYKRYVPVIGTTGLFILLSNLMGLIPGFATPTDNINTTAACAVVVWIYFNYHGFRVNGIGHITHLLNPIGEPWGWILAPLVGSVEVISLIARCLTLALRLMVNMVGDHAVLFAFAGIMPFLVPLPFYAMGTLVCLIQTAVFCILSTVYIGLHTAEAEH